MKNIESNLPCPACHGPMTPRVLACETCQLRVEGAFVFNEFSTLSPELLHLLRIFVHCEGRIKDMEKALGVSYPTVKGLMTQLKAALRLPAADTDAPAPPGPAPAATPDEPASRLDVLAALERGELTHDEAVRRLRQRKS